MSWFLPSVAAWTLNFDGSASRESLKLSLEELVMWRDSCAHAA